MENSTATPLCTMRWVPESPIVTGVERSLGIAGFFVVSDVVRAGAVGRLGCS
jgi:hypothetical protein